MFNYRLWFARIVFVKMLLSIVNRTAKLRRKALHTMSSEEMQDQ